MPLSDYDHIEAIRNRLINLLRAKEQEIKELQDKIAVLGEAPRLLS